MRTKEQIEQYLDDDELQKTQDAITIQELEYYLDNIQFLSPNEPITEYGVQRILKQLDYAIKILEHDAGVKSGKTITLWSPNITYSKDDIVLYFKQEKEQVSPDVPKREFAFLLMSMEDGNSSIPNYDLIDGIPDFIKSNWNLLNPMSYLLQDLIELKKVVHDVFSSLLKLHVKNEHGIISTSDIENNLLKKDYSNLYTWDKLGKFSLYNGNVETSKTGIVQNIKMSSNGIMEISVRYSFDLKANQQILINDSKYYYQKSPIFDESDQTIFSRKYMEDDMFNVNVHKVVEELEGNSTKTTYTSFNNLRYGTNIFNCHIEFNPKFLNDEYCVFFDTYDNGQFVFGFNKTDIESQTEPTYDQVVSMPMIMNKTSSGFDVVLPIHTYFNSIQKYRIGVPWKNEFRLQVIGRFR